MATPNNPLLLMPRLPGTEDKYNHEILERPDEKTLEFIVACYTRKTFDNKSLRQSWYSLLYQRAEQLGTQDQEFPFGKDSHEIELVPDTANKYDPHATLVYINMFGGGIMTPTSGSYDMGYVPQKVSKHVRENMNRIISGRIYKVYKNIFGTEYYAAKVILGYDNNELRGPMSTQFRRFSGLVDEL